jgi:hypothetical protein
VQIFVTDPCPIKCAKFLDNRRVNKMCTETSQLLSNAMWLNGGQGPYKLTHRNTKISKWVCENKGNYWWTLRHLIGLHIEYRNRFTKIHKTECDGLIDLFSNFYRNMPDGDATPFINNAKRKDLDLDFTHLTDVFGAYKEYLSTRWELEKKSKE